LKHKNTKRNYAVGVAYRYPTNNHEYFIDSLNDSIMRLTKNKTFLLSSNSYANTLKNMLWNNSVYPLVTTNGVGRKISKGGGGGLTEKRSKNSKKHQK